MRLLAHVHPRGIKHWGLKRPVWGLLCHKGTGAHQFSSVQSPSCVRLFATPWTAACQASLSIANSQSLIKLMSIDSHIGCGYDFVATYATSYTWKLLLMAFPKSENRHSKRTLTFLPPGSIASPGYSLKHHLYRKHHECQGATRQLSTRCPWGTRGGGGHGSPLKKRSNFFIVVQA